MPHTETSDRLAQLMGELERGLLGEGDAGVVDRLAKANPAHAKQLYQFFADLVEAELSVDEAHVELKGLDTLIRQRLASLNNEIVTQRVAATSPTSATSSMPMPGSVSDAHATPSWQPSSPGGGSDTTPAWRLFGPLLRECSGRTQHDIATALDLSFDFLVSISEHAELVPVRVKNALVDLALTRLALDPVSHRDPLLAALGRGSAGMPMAASRDSPYSSRQLTFTTIVRESSLSADQKTFWLSLLDE